MLLDNVNNPNDIKDLSMTELDQLAAEIREYLISSVSETGGHLAPNLGAVELTIALHHVFETPKDQMHFVVSSFFTEVPHQTNKGGHPTTARYKHQIFPMKERVMIKIASGFGNIQNIPHFDMTT